MTKLLISFVAIATIQTASVQAATLCGPHDGIGAKLTRQYQESRKALGIAGQAQVIELYVSDRGSWTLVATDTKGQACVIGAGEAWQDSPIIVAGTDS
jgi:hypothetical protein